MSSPYSPERYRDLLRTIAESGYRAVDFAGLHPESDERELILRHDVDVSPRLALDMAEINRSHGVSATFFFLVRSHVYNLFSATNARVLHEIERSGQAIALHCGLPPTVPATEAELVKLVQDELAIGRCAFPSLGSTFAWHTTPPGFLERWGALAVPGVVNAYDPQYVSRMAFVSDSNARHSPEELAAVFRRGAHRKVQLLIHPVIWMCGGAGMMEVWSNAWKCLVREIEVELSTNTTYRRQLPNGISQATVEGFSAALLADAAAVPE